MSRSRVIVLCIAVALSALVVNSTTALIAGLNPPIFKGLLFVALLIMSAVCWITYIFAVRADRLQRCDRRERVRNFSTAIHFVDGDAETDSGSWRRSSLS